MANFTTESEVRLKFQLDDTTLVPSSLVTQSIDDAHEELLRFLDPQYDTGDPDDPLILGETLLAGAHLFRSLASKEAFEQKRTTVGGQRIEEGARFTALTAVASLTEDQGWYVLAPYLASRPARSVAAVTASTPVLGA